MTAASDPVRLRELGARFWGITAATALSTFGDWLALGALGKLVFDHRGTFELGLLQSVEPATSVLLGAPLALAIDRYAPPRLAVLANLGLALVALGFLGFDLRTYFLLLVVKQTLYLVNGTAGARLVSYVLAERQIHRGLAVQNLLCQLATALGIALGPWLADWVGTRVFVFDAVTFAVLGLTWWAVTHGVPPRPSAAVSSTTRSAELRALVGRPAWLALLGLFAYAHLLWGLKDVAAFALVTNTGLHSAASGSYLAIAFVVELGVGLLLARFASRARYQRLLVPAFATLAAAFVLGGLAPGWHALFAVKGLEGAASLLTGVTFGTTLVFDAPEHLRGRLAGLLASVTATALVCGKLGGGYLVVLAGAPTVYVLVGGVGLLLAGAFTLLRTLPAPALDGVEG